MVNFRCDGGGRRGEHEMSAELVDGLLEVTLDKGTRVVPSTVVAGDLISEVFVNHAPCIDEAKDAVEQMLRNAVKNLNE